MKQITAIVLALLMAATPLSVFTGVVASSELVTEKPFAGGTFGGGDGSASTPYIIEDVLDLQNMSANLNAYYTLGNDINASETRTWNGGQGFMPVGISSDFFNGILLGGNHSISGLFINRTTNEIGLFGFTNGKIENVHLKDVNITGLDYTGGLVGDNRGKISNCSVSGIIHGGGCVGGLAGSTWTIITNSSADAEVFGTNYVGGLVGYNQQTTILRCMSTGNVKGLNDVGGLVGRNVMSATISDSYSTGNVNGTNNIGGLVGFFQGPIAGQATNCYSTGLVQGITTGGFVCDAGPGIFTACFWDNQTSGQITSAGGAGVMGRTTAQMLTQATFVGWDFANTWWMVDGETRPFLRMEYDTEITNSHQLQMMAMDLTADYTLRCDIDLSDIIEPSQMWGTSITTGGGFWPVGRLATPFMGSFTGNNHTLNGLYLNRPSDNNVALFGYTNANPVFSGITIENADIVGNQYSAILCGATMGDVENVVVSGNVSGGDYTAGLVGATFGDISNSSASATVDAPSGSNVGGLVGYNSGTISNNSYATRNVSGSSRIGGLVGWNDGGTASNCYATGNVSSSNDYVGGLVGDNVAASVIESCQASGNVKATGDYSGGLIGRSSGPVMNSTAYGVVNSTGWYVGGLIGSNNGDIENCTSYGDIVDASLFSGGISGDNAAKISHCSAYGTISGASNYCGGLVGRNFGAIENSSTFGTVDGVAWTGGLVGDNTGGATVRNCSADADTSGDTYVGGLVGSNDGEITTSYSTGTVTFISSSSGGLVGRNTATGTIANCYSHTNITGNVMVGGLIGNHTGGGSVTNCYSTGSVAGNNNLGGLIGVNWGSTVNDCFWDQNTSGQAGSAGGIGEITSDMMLQATFTNWDFTTIWGIYETNTYPFLRSVGVEPVVNADLGIILVDLTDPATVGKTLTYGVGLNNHGPNNAIGIKANVTLPLGTTFINATVPFNVNGRYLTVDPADMANGETVGAFINVSVDSYGTGVLNCTVFITASTPDAGLYPNETYATTIVNRPPIAVNDSYQTTEDYIQIILAPGILNNDYDPDVDIFNVTNNEGSDYGAAITVNANGSFTYNPTVSSTLQALHGGISVYDTFNYTISDGRGGTATATITMQVDGQEGWPTAVNDTYTVQEDSSLNAMSVLANDIADEEGDTMTITSTGTIWQGTITITGGGTGLSFTPNANYFGTFDFNYWLSDGHGVTDMGNVNVTVTGVNDAPHIGTIVNDETAMENESYIWNYSADDLVDGDPITWSLVTNATWLSINATGVLSGTPPFGSAGAYSVNLTVSDGHGGADWLEFMLTVLADTDGDGTPNSSDNDDDGDGVPDGSDDLPLDPDETTDTDDDGIGNNADTDDDGDGVLDADDAFPLDPTESVDTDGDDIGNNADTDDDGDGIPDSEDANPLVPDEEGAGDDNTGGNNMMLYLIIIIIVVVVVVLAAIMLRPKAKKPEPAWQETPPPPPKP